MAEDKKVPNFKGFLTERMANDPSIVAQQMRAAGLPVSHTMFATIHHASENRPDGWEPEELDEIAQELHEADLERWKAELAAHHGGAGPDDDAEGNGNE